MVSDQLRDYCCLMGNLVFQYNDADFSASKACITGDSSNDIVQSSYFAENNLIVKQ